jgi:hypothetical protein
MKSIAIICFSLLVLGGCDLFNTRDAEKPSLARSNFQSAVTPDLVIQNLANSLIDKNVQNYLACLSDTSFGGKSYLFSPSSGAASLYPSFAAPWDKTNEETYFKTLITRIPADLQANLVITNADSSRQGESIIYSASYALTVPFTDSSIPSSYRGDLKFSLSMDSRHVWSIYLWQDIKSTDSPSWSELKGRLY